MKALVYHGPGSKAWEEVSAPTLQADTDIIVRVDKTTICGSDLHILKGDTPEVTEVASGPRGRGHGRDRGHGRQDDRGRRQGARLVHQRLWRLSILPRGSLRAVPRRGRLDPRSSHRRHTG